MTYTIIILTLNAGAKFGMLIDALAVQTVNMQEILIVDSSSTDGTRELAKGLGCRVIKIGRSNFDHGTTRNLAMFEVSTEFAW